jgi:hypothetical protein
MKKMINIAILLFFLIGCKEEVLEQDENSIYGTWKLIEVFSGPPSGDGWNQIENGYTYEILSSGEFNSSKYDECSTGTFSVSDQTIFFNYDCENFNPCGANSTSCQESFSFEGKFLVLKPDYLQCDEGCGYKFKKIADEIRETD